MKVNNLPPWDKGEHQVKIAIELGLILQRELHINAPIAYVLPGHQVRIEDMSLDLLREETDQFNALSHKERARLIKIARDHAARQAKKEKRK